MRMKLVMLAALAVVSARAGAQQDSRRLNATLAPLAVKGAQAAPSGAGTAALRLALGADSLCVEVGVSGVAKPTAAHVHLGGNGASGPTVLTLPLGADGKGSGCMAANRALIRDLLESPADYYVDVHTAEFPKGALRGQLHF